MQENKTCQHKVLPEHCSSCQIITFLLCLKERRIIVPIDISRSILFKKIRGERKIHLLEILSNIRIVFIGSEEAFCGFLCSMQVKYSAYVPSTLEVDEIIRNRWIDGHTVTSSPFAMDEYKHVNTFLEVSDYPSYETTHYFAILDEHDFIDGYRKMMELEIKKLWGVSDNLGIVLKRTNFFIIPKNKEKCIAYWYYF